MVDQDIDRRGQQPVSDYRDLLIGDLADAEACLAEMTHERDIYRDAWRTAIHEHHEVLRELESMRRQS